MTAENLRAEHPAVRPLDAAATGVIVLICLGWGLNQVAVKLALPDIPPFTQAAIRLGGALLLVFGWARLRAIPLFERDGTLVPGMVAGSLFALEFVLIYQGLVLTTASRAVVFLYTAPFFVALGVRWLGERLRLGQWGGLALSFFGVALAMGVPQHAVDRTVLLGDFLLLAAGAMWAATTLVIKGTRLARVSSTKTTAYQLLVSAPLLGVLAFLSGERMTGMPGAGPLAWLAYQTVVVGLTYAIWFAMIVRYSASRLSAFTFLTPLFGIAAGHFLMGDPITLPFAMAAVLVVAGLVLVNRPS